MSYRIEMKGEVLLPGRAQGGVVALDEPLSFWGGFDAIRGTVMDRRHPQCGQTLTGGIVVMTAARGSSSGSSVLAEAIRLGTAPAAFIVTERDAILVVGAMVAFELYGLACPIVRVSESDHQCLRHAGQVSLDAATATAHITYRPQ
jgi:uncharacterized protein